jgi:HlyD family secretion protein
MKRKTWFILAAATVGTLLVWWAFRWLSSAVEVDAAKAEMRPIREFVEERAKTRLPQTYLITMPYTARAKPILLTEGSAVKQGEAVAQIVPIDLKLSVAEATAGREEADASIAQNADTKLEEVALKQVQEFSVAMKAATEAAEKQKESGQAGLGYALRDWARIERLYRTGAETEDTLELARLRRVQREVEYQQYVLTHQAMRSAQIATDLLKDLLREYIARKQLNAAVLRQRQAQADVRMRKALLEQDRGTMTSPVDGVVLRRAESNERLLSAGTPLLEIGRLEDLEVEADVLSLDVVKVKEGQRVEIYGPAVGQRRADGKDHADGTVYKIYPAGFTKISSLGVEQQRVKVIVRFSDEDLRWLRQQRNLGVGYRVSVRIYTAEKPSTLVIPRSALFRGTRGEWQVYTIRNGRARIQDVQVGLINDRSAEIASGLSQGELVVLAPESNLTQAARVSVKRTEEEED